MRFFVEYETERFPKISGNSVMSKFIHVEESFNRTYEIAVLRHCMSDLYQMGLERTITMVFRLQTSVPSQNNVNRGRQQARGDMDAIF